MFTALVASYMVAQYIAPRAVNRTVLSQQSTFHVQVGNPTQKTGDFYIDPVSMNEDGQPSFQIEEDVQLSARKVRLRGKALRRINATAQMGNVDRAFFVCTSPAEPTIIRQGSREKSAIGIRARACSRVELKRTKWKKR